ncbi:MAG: hypothetical protein P9L92_15195 [Candidatus Electryonea clarkiae]|nr:hypothetical protein [Candidatus Electryonea clarkiae]MDP8287526.1 hypothetical protein [Candidatus Electryonea clarkiae]
MRFEQWEDNIPFTCGSRWRITRQYGVLHTADLSSIIGRYYLTFSGMKA